jgi:23S rRNA (cytosine1962-C5)-methyltransferase
VAEGSVVISPRGVERLRAGHLWIYRSDVRSAEAEAGAIVRLTDERGRFHGRAFYSDKSQIAIRLITPHDVPVDRAFFTQRFQRAAEFRKRIVENTEAYRLVYGEADLLSSLVVDRYGDYLVIQTLSQGTERQKDLFVQILVELFSPKGILERNDPRVRLLEALDQRVSVLYGEIPSEIQARENGISFIYDLQKGQKTGAFLDQRENYLAAARYARGKALDCFTSSGGFALHLASRCESVEAVDSSAASLATAERNRVANAIANVEFREADVFDLLAGYSSARREFSMVVLDPPAFAKSRGSLEGALRGYKDINLRALRLLGPGGVLVTCSCSHHLSEAALLETVAAASLDAGRKLRVLERRTQSQDHPILLTVPETHYLKCLILQVV